MRKLLLLSIFFLFLYFSWTTLLPAFRERYQENVDQINKLSVESANIVKSPIDAYYAQNQTKVNVLSAVGKGDSRVVIVDNFLASHNSPMAGLGQVFVDAADEYSLDYRLLPAIAFQESTLGKAIPRDSHNAWGWAIYTGEDSGAYFNDWTHAINVVARGLKNDYIDRGLTTTEAIQTRYTASQGSWAYGVNFAIEQMTP